MEKDKGTRSREERLGVRYAEKAKNLGLVPVFDTEICRVFRRFRVNPNRVKSGQLANEHELKNLN